MDSELHSKLIKQLDAGMKSLSDQIRELKDRHCRESQEMLRQVFDTFFQKAPAVYAVRWTQYTPHWNDGDECVFEVNGPEFYTQGMHERGEVEQLSNSYGSDFNPFVHRKWFKEVSDAVCAELGQEEYDRTALEVSTFLEDFWALGEDVMAYTFGDHKQVTATRDGFEVETYSHE